MIGTLATDGFRATFQPRLAAARRLGESDSNRAYLAAVLAALTCNVALAWVWWLWEAAELRRDIPADLLEGVERASRSGFLALIGGYAAISAAEYWLGPRVVPLLADKIVGVGDRARSLVWLYLTVLAVTVISLLATIADVLIEWTMLDQTGLPWGVTIATLLVSLIVLVLLSRHSFGQGALWRHLALSLCWTIVVVIVAVAAYVPIMLWTA